MHDLLFLVPLLIGAGVMALGFKFQMPKGPAMNRPVFGLSLIVGSLFWWLSTAILLVHKGSYYFVFNLLSVLIFFLGLAFFFPKPPTATDPHQHSATATILIWIGFVLGVAHCVAMMFTSSWPTLLLELYAGLGLHAAPPPNVD